MNRMLAKIAGALNAVVAFSMVAVGALLGRAWGDIGDILGLLIGAFLGLMMAVIVCGFGAQLADMRNLLQEIRDQGRRSGVSGGHVPASELSPWEAAMKKRNQS